MTQPLIIVESPAKARTIQRLLGKGYLVASSVGHIRDLPQRTSDMPPKLRKKAWARTGVDVDNGFKPYYVVPTDRKRQVSQLKELLAQASTLYLGTDEDREGEAIAWHLLEVLKPKVPVKRLVFHEITKKAIEQALETPRDIDRHLIDAQEARRILDRLYGYEVSPVLWRKVRPRLSAGRVQSVATRLVVDREKQRRAFKRAEYYSLSAVLRKPDVEGTVDSLTAELQEVAGRRIAIGRHFEPTTGDLTDTARADRVLRLDLAAAVELRRGIEGGAFEVSEVHKKPFTQRPHPPFITSTLQQEAGRKLGYTAQRTMRVAQRLYENGFITYMRTDSTVLSDEALQAARSAIVELFGQPYLPEAPRTYTTKVKGAQEAHEAIRPAGESFRRPDAVQGELSEEEARLYDLIWKRTVASQMRNATGERTQARISVEVPAGVGVAGKGELAGRAVFGASGQVITFAGYLRAYVEGTDDPEAELEDKERLLPPLDRGDALQLTAIEPRHHETQPPPRYTEASLVRELEERGIGRPSTYATIIQTIQDRGYVWKQGGALVPTLTAFAVTNLLTKHFDELVDYAFTARMEDELDAISNGQKESTPWLAYFYFGESGPSADAEATASSSPGQSEHKGVADDDRSKGDNDEGPDGTRLTRVGLKGLIGTGVEQIDPRDISSLEIGRTPDGEVLAARVGRFGPYLQVGDTDRRVSIADDVLLDELDAARAMHLIRQADLGNRLLGTDPETGKNVYLKTGSYGPYVQLGDAELTPKGAVKKGSPKPKMVSLWPDMSVETITLDEALMLLSYPRLLGTHPETGAPVLAQVGRYGPYVATTSPNGRTESRSLENHDQLRTIDLDRAVQLLAEPRPQRGRQQSAGVLAKLGVSPTSGQGVEVREGRFGPYVTDGQVNASIPRGRDPQRVSFDEAIELIAGREQKLRDQGVDPRAAKVAARRRPTGRRSTTVRMTRKSKSTGKTTASSVDD